MPIYGEDFDDIRGKVTEVITGDGREVKRHRIDLSASESFGEMPLKVDIDVTGQRWLRVEVWDIATNGAFTQPVWLNER